MVSEKYKEIILKTNERIDQLVKNIQKKLIDSALEKEKANFYKKNKVEARPEDIEQMKKDIIWRSSTRIFIIVAILVFVIVFAIK